MKTGKNYTYTLLYKALGMINVLAFIYLGMRNMSNPVLLSSYAGYALSSILASYGIVYMLKVKCIKSSKREYKKNLLNAKFEKMICLLEIVFVCVAISLYYLSDKIFGDPGTIGLALFVCIVLYSFDSVLDKYCNTYAELKIRCGIGTSKENDQNKRK